ncbi:MAG: hypothetical protein RIB55_11310 [Nitratireductor sp.]
MNSTVAASGIGFSLKTLLLAAASSLLAGLIASQARAQDCDIRNLEGTGNSTQVAQANFTCMTARLTATLARIEALESELEPFRRASGIVAAFDRSEEDACPRGWERFAPAGGRMIVGAGVNNNVDENGQSLSRYPALMDDPDGAQGGAEWHALKAEEMPTHSHEFNGTSVLRGQWTGLPAVALSVGGEGAGVHQPFVPEGTISETGGSQPHNNMPPYLALYYCIRR